MRVTTSDSTTRFIAFKLEHVAYGALLCPIFGKKAGVNCIINWGHVFISPQHQLIIPCSLLSMSLSTGLKGPEGCRGFRAPCHGLRHLASHPVTP